ncbi:hypothetical protein Tco_0219001 [Tanacetum coccineum]
MSAKGEKIVGKSHLITEAYNTRSCGASATPYAKALPQAGFLLFPWLVFPSIASTGFGRFPPKIVARFILGQFLLKWLGSPHSKQIGLGLSLIALPVQYWVKWPTWLHQPHTGQLPE